MSLGNRRDNPGLAGHEGSANQMDDVEGVGLGVGGGGGSLL